MGKIISKGGTNYFQKGETIIFKRGENYFQKGENNVTRKYTPIMYWLIPGFPASDIAPGSTEPAGYLYT